jgi:prolyl-tRNA synthetase
MYEAYSRIFSRCGLTFKAVEADTGPIGGSFSHEFMVLAATGEDFLASCTSCDYAANLEKAEVPAPPDNPGPLPAGAPTLMATPGVRTVEEVAAFLKVQPQDIAKTLIYETDQGPVAVLIRGDQEVNEVKVKNLLGATELLLAGPARVKELTSAEVGFAGPLGLTIPVYADQAVAALPAMVTGANKDGHHLTGVHPRRDLQFARVADLRQVTEQDPCPRCGATLTMFKGIEVGHVFKLGFKYSKALNAKFLDAEGEEQYIFMGCYGIGVSRIVAAAIEQGHDADGIIWPMALAPFQVGLVPINVNDEITRETANRLHDELEAAGIEVLLDDRDERPGVKFKDMDLLGLPIRVVVGPKTLAQGQAEVRQRRSPDVSLIDLDRLFTYIKDLINQELS